MSGDPFCKANMFVFKPPHLLFMSSNVSIAKYRWELESSGNIVLAFGPKRKFEEISVYFTAYLAICLPERE